MQTLIKPLAALLLVLGLAACADDQYPLSGDECGPTDPVQTLDIDDCGVPNV